MNSIATTALLLAGIALAHSATPVPVATLHVCASLGSDAGSGSSEHPLLTLPAARDAARRLRAKHAAGSSVEIVLHAAGVHRLTEPLVLDARDSHTVYRAAGDVLVSGGIAVDTAAVAPRPGHTGQYQVNMTALGLIDLGTVLPDSSKPPSGHALGLAPLHPQLFIGEQVGWLARWPNAINLTSWQ